MRRPAREPGEPVRDPEAAAKRAAEREARVAGGVEDLRLWLRDAVRGGLAAPRLRGWEEWDAFAARMVDAQAPGAASRLRSLGNVAAARPDGWPERLLSGMGMLHLLCEAYAKAPDGPLRDEVRTLLGWNASREEVLSGPRVQDEWAVLARVVIEQERLRVQRTWLWGHDTERAALLLDFAPPGGSLTPRPPTGTSFEAGLAFYPGATPLRALLEEPGALKEAPGFFGVGGVEVALAAGAEAVAANPWLDEFPVALARAVADVDVVSAEDGSLPLRGGRAGAVAVARALGGAAGVRVRAVGRRGVASAGRGGRGTDGGAVKRKRRHPLSLKEVRPLYATDVASRAVKA